MAVFLFFFWKKEGKLPFPIGIFGNPLFGIMGLPPPVNINPTPPTPVCPVCPSGGTCPTPPPCPTCPPCPGKEKIKQEIGKMPVNVTWTTTVGEPGGQTYYPTYSQNTTLGQIPGEIQDFHRMQAIAEKTGIHYQIDESSLKINRLNEPIFDEDVQHNIKAFGLQKLGYNGPNAQHINRTIVTSPTNSPPPSPPPSGVIQIYQ